MSSHLDAHAPMGANLAGNGATFRVWAPGAQSVHLTSGLTGWQPDNGNLMARDANGTWSGYWDGFKDGTPYKFYVVGPGSSGYNRDPYARELAADRPFPHVDCIVRDPRRYPWRAQQWRTPDFSEFIIYQLHVGTFWSPNGGQQRGTFLDVAQQLPYLADLGINVLQLLPIVEFNTQFSLGYNGTDYFSPENDYALPPAEVASRLPAINALFAAKGQPPLQPSDVDGSANQLRCLVDLAHLHGIAVLFDVVYNHAGGDWGEGSLYFFDRQPFRTNNDSLYFTDRGHAGGLCFAVWKEAVRQFLIDNAQFLLAEYRIDGLRHDQVSVLDHENAGSGWLLCQHLTDTCRAVNPRAVQHAEYWPVNPPAVRPTWAGGAGFDLCYHDGLRDAVRATLGAARTGAQAFLNLRGVLGALWPAGLPQSWRGVHNLETHDEVYRERKPRIARLADGLDARSWYARSRSRVATGLLLTAPGTPMLFMGQEFLEEEPWADDLANHAHLRISWASLDAADPAHRDFRRCVRDLAWLRRNHPGLRGEGFNPYHVDEGNRVLAFHRWAPGAGHDVVVVASWSEKTHYGYELGFPRAGRWRELFNSDVYDNWPNPSVAGNGGSIVAAGAPRHHLPASAALVLPANSLLVFAL